MALCLALKHFAARVAHFEQALLPELVQIHWQLN
jgi:hypothetical protein